MRPHTVQKSWRRALNVAGGAFAVKDVSTPSASTACRGRPTCSALAMVRRFASEDTKAEAASWQQTPADGVGSPPRSTRSALSRRAVTPAVPAAETAPLSDRPNVRQGSGELHPLQIVTRIKVGCPGNVHAVDVAAAFEEQLVPAYRDGRVRSKARRYAVTRGKPIADVEDDVRPSPLAGANRR